MSETSDIIFRVLIISACSVIGFLLCMLLMWRFALRSPADSGKRGLGWSSTGARTTEYVSVPQKAEHQLSEIREPELESNDIGMHAASVVRSYPDVYLARSQCHLHIGSREEKSWFLLNRRGANKDQQAVLSLMPLRNLPLDARDAALVSKALLALSSAHHPNVLRTVSLDWMENARMVAVVRPFLKKGSLRDMLHKSDPIKSFRSKYFGTPYPMSEAAIARVGRQVLDGLLFLEEMGMPYFSVHCGNIIIDDNPHEIKGRTIDTGHYGCRITDYESDLIGLQPRIHKLHIYDTNHHLTNISFHAIAFAHVIYELSTGYILQKKRPDLQVVNKCDPSVRSLLHAVLLGDDDRGDWADEDGAITCQSLRSSPFFTDGPSRRLPGGTKKSSPNSKWSIPPGLLDGNVQSFIGRRRERLSGMF